MSDEQILVVPANLFRAIGYFEGFSPDVPVYNMLLDEAVFKPRLLMETDDSYKQLIPYTTIMTEKEPNRPLFLSYQRGSELAEERLHGKRSIGFGGHINPEDTAEGDDYTLGGYGAAVMRELHEEVKLPERLKAPPALAGIINEDATEVGRVHLGLFHIVFIGGGFEPEPNEAGMCDFRWQTLEQLQANLMEYEKWSRILIESSALLDGIQEDGTEPSHPSSE